MVWVVVEELFSILVIIFYVYYGVKVWSLSYNLFLRFNQPFSNDP